MGLLDEGRFAKAVAFVYSPAGERVRTNNHVERTNRKLRYFEKVRYKWRRRRWVVRYLVLALDHWWSEAAAAEAASGTPPPDGQRPPPADAAAERRPGQRRAAG